MESTAVLLFLMNTQLHEDFLMIFVLFPLDRLGNLAIFIAAWLLIKPFAANMIELLDFYCFQHEKMGLVLEKVSLLPWKPSGEFLEFFVYHSVRTMHFST